MDDSRIVNHEVASLEEAKSFFETVSALSRFNCSVYDKEAEQFVEI
jgi:hypothetical protein